MISVIYIYNSYHIYIFIAGDIQYSIYPPGQFPVVITHLPAQYRPGQSSTSSVEVATFFAPGDAKPSRAIH